MAGMRSLDDHLKRATRLALPGRRVTLLLGGSAIGLLTPEIAALLDPHDGAVRLADAQALGAAESALAAAGVFRPRGELFDVRAAWDGAVLAQVDRGALPVLGIEAQGVHVNGLVRDGAGWRLWVARRSATKALDAGKLDHMVAGGICAGMDAAATLVKEAGEEACVPAALARTARFVGTLAYAIERPEGLRRDRLHCYDLVVPGGFVPVAGDGEVEGFALLPLDEVMRGVRDTDEYKFNVNLVLIDLFARLGLVPVSAALLRLRDS
jgi:8-oxo-dGTP pyrophosphatase MutT (NUDIX family)